jgi:hypothetical protein
MSRKFLKTIVEADSNENPDGGDIRPNGNHWAEDILSFRGG